MFVDGIFGYFRKKGHLIAMRLLEGRYPIGWRTAPYDLKPFRRITSEATTCRKCESLLKVADDFNPDYYLSTAQKEADCAKDALRKERQEHLADIAYMRRYQAKILREKERQREKIAEQLQRVTARKERLRDELEDEET